MNSKNQTVAFLILLAQTVVGLAVLMLVKLIPTPSWFSPSLLALLIFIILNVALAHLLNIKNELKNFWTLKKSYLLPLGAVGGLLIAAFPSLLALIFSEITFDQIIFQQAISFQTIGITLIIVGWEELWFRSILLNYCKRTLSPTTVSLLIGLFFMLVHLLNPNFEILNAGLALFFAGTFLTMSYFYTQSIWAPVGLHFGNNIFSNLFEVEFKNQLLFGSDGYISALILAALTLILWQKLKTNKFMLNYSLAYSNR